MSALDVLHAGTGAATRVARLLAEERAAFVAFRPRGATAEAPGWAGGVPMHWMLDWSTPFPPAVAHAEGVVLSDIDGNALVDFCLGDTAAMFGHAPAPVRRALAGCTAYSTMLPSADAAVVGGLLAARFGLPAWQVSTSASEANRAALRVARAATGRRRVLVFDGCYHGAVDEALVVPAPRGARPAPGLIGAPAGVADNTVCVEFNDVPALADALAGRDVACVLAEPALTNCGMVLPAPGFHAALRQLTREAGTLLVLDETHTLSAGPGGCTRRDGLEPDILVVGKAIGGGVPVAVWGMTEAVANAFARGRADVPTHGRTGIGTTLSGAALPLAALRACLAEVMTDAAYAHMLRVADVVEAGLSAAIGRHDVPWHVARIGARLEVVMAPGPLRNAADARAAERPEMSALVHLGLLNRGFLVTPFHLMLLASPATTDEHAEGLVAAFDALLARQAEPEP